MQLWLFIAGFSQNYVLYTLLSDTSLDLNPASCTALIGAPCTSVGRAFSLNSWWLCVCVHTYIRMYACMHACVYVCMHVCMYACVHVHVYVWLFVLLVYHLSSLVPRPSSFIQHAKWSRRPGITSHMTWRQARRPGVEATVFLTSKARETSGIEASLALSCGPLTNCGTGHCNRCEMHGRVLAIGGSAHAR